MKELNFHLQARSMPIFIAALLTLFLQSSAKAQSINETMVVAPGVASPDIRLIEALAGKKLISISAFGIDVNPEGASEELKALYNDKEEMPTVLDFYSDWCQPCKLLKKDLNKVEKRYKGKVRVISVDVANPAHRYLLRRYHVGPIPALVYLDSKGKMITQTIGYSGMEEIVWGFRQLLRCEKFYNAASKSAPKDMAQTKNSWQ
jgi:thiol:disulfide interchange protein